MYFWEKIIIFQKFSFFSKTQIFFEIHLFSRKNWIFSTQLSILHDVHFWVYLRVIVTSVIGRHKSAGSYLNGHSWRRKIVSGRWHKPIQNKCRSLFPILNWFNHQSPILSYKSGVAYNKGKIKKSKKIFLFGNTFKVKKFCE